MYFNYSLNYLIIIKKLNILLLRILYKIIATLIEYFTPKCLLNLGIYYVY